MNTEQKGQYYFTPDEGGNLRVQENPLGILIPQDSPETVIEEDKRSSWVQRLGEKIGLMKRSPEIVSPQTAPRLEDFEWDPRTDEEMRLLHDALLTDLEEKGILDVIARETNVDPQGWADRGKASYYKRTLPERKPDIWEVDFIGPRVKYDMVPGPGRWSGGCVRAIPIAQNYMTIQLSIGPEWDERIVSLSYDRHRDLEMAGAETSVINLGQGVRGHNKYLFQEHLRDAMNNPYNPYYVTEGGFLSPAVFRRHQHELNAARAREHAAA